MFDPDTSRMLAAKLAKLPAGDQWQARLAVGEEDLKRDSKLSRLPVAVRRMLGLANKTSKEEGS